MDGRTARLIGTLAVFAVLAADADARPAPSQPITKLKDLRLTTTLAAGGRAEAVIVAPPGEKYAAAVQTIQQAVRRAAGVELPVRRDGPNPEKVLEQHHVVAFGNMATNPFVAHMYRQWYVLLDLKYPGRGGYVVRSLHNPYATGRNVIWVGGSDDAGVARAAEVLAGLLEPGDPLSLGWVMEVKLGVGLIPPRIDENDAKWDVRGWRDSRRRVGKTEVGYAPSTFFGWNPISVAGVLYYMTGQKRYLDTFKAIALPDPKRVPVVNRSGDAFTDPKDPLVRNDHYRAHLVDCVFDLIEESPLFTDAERLGITNKLLEHQNAYDPRDDYARPNGGRHRKWHMLCIYTGSRYFAKYYPAPRWTKRIGNVRGAFRAWIGNPTWGGSDTRHWVSTYVEPVFEFFMLDGSEDFVSGGTARTMIGAIETLWSGRRIEESNGSLSISLLHKASHMLRDGRYAWLARNLGFDFGVFRIGQSYWPPEALKISPPTDLVGRISLYPLPRADWERSGKSVLIEEGFEDLSYRSGLSPKDDFFEIDGHFGAGRATYHVNALYRLRMFGGQELLSGYGNQIHIRRNGMVARKVARPAALESAVVLNDVVYVRTRVPNAPFSSWQRHLLYAKDRYAFVLDAITPRESGTFDITCGWDMGEPGRISTSVPHTVTARAGGTVCCSPPMTIDLRGKAVRQRWTTEGRCDEPIILANLVYSRRVTQGKGYRVLPLGGGAHLLEGPTKALVCAGDLDTPALSFSGEFAHVTAGGFFLVNARRLTCRGRPLARFDRPTSMTWDLRTGELAVLEPSATAATRPSDARRPPPTPQRARVKPKSDVAEAVAASLEALSGQVRRLDPPANPAPPEIDWTAEWTTTLSGSVTHLAATSYAGPAAIWAILADRSTKNVGGRKVAFGTVSLLSRGGKPLRSRVFAALPLSLWAAADPTQAGAFAALVGLRNDTLQALSADGGDLWSCKASIHPSFKVGDRYEAPWFSDPSPGRDHRGVYSILVGDFWGTGKQEIAIGRPCTVEFHKLGGGLIERVPTKWGDNTSLAVLSKPGRRSTRKPPPWLLVGKTNTGKPQLSAIDSEHRLVGNAMYIADGPGTTSMHAFRQRGVSQLVTEDLDGDGVQEVIVALSGHWNQVNVYRGADGRRCLWTRCFGQAPSESRFITALALADLTDDGATEIVVGMENGWICAFDKAGTPVWQRRFPSAVKSMLVLDGPARLIVGCADGTLHLIDGHARSLHTAKIEGGVAAMIYHEGAVVVGTDSGTIAKYLPPP